MRISDWSSDVCASDLPEQPFERHAASGERVGKAEGERDGADGADGCDDERILNRLEQRRRREVGGVVREYDVARRAQHDAAQGVGIDLLPGRWEERREGPEGVSKGGSRWSPNHAQSQ